jgi:hypothetical protein
VIEAELTELASRSLWLVSPRRSLGARDLIERPWSIDPVRPFVDQDISGADPCLFEPMLDRVQGLSEGSVRFRVGLKLYFAVRPERDALTAEEADQPDHKTLRALNILCRYPNHHHDPLSAPLRLVLVWCA